MASSIFSLASTSAMLFVLVFLSSTANSDIDIPSPIVDNLCDQVSCGRGNCSLDRAKPFNFVCKCYPGWRRTLISDTEDDLQFLPCVIPNCSINYSCMPAPPPSPPIPDNITIFDPCYWTYCGEGTCNKNHTTDKHACNCNPGYTNLMNISIFPCFRDCAIGTDCSRVGVRSSDTTPPPGDSSQGETAGLAASQGIRFLSGGFHCIGVIVMSVALALWK
ncbi:hypothetical protein M8C21_021909 [Ambrosia artemisiifolia]|uniref:Uncharacterized protein n=1 Tax=Ambrosia artemisiifolia TaxID=4212 RepID=A0AAD5CDB8_AMBAR|nr:hypothetical protein M8C21_021909 [Ambrosia artemisiifolia]